MLRGVAGIGKSVLLKHLVGAASDLTLAHATGVQSEMTIPFAGLHQLCARMLDQLDDLPSPQRDAAAAAFGIHVGGPPDRLLVGLAVLNLLAAKAEEQRPLLCVVDDAHWLDRESAQVLAFAARRIEADPIGLVFAIREPHAELAGFQQLVVEPLEADDARSLLEEVVHGRLDERVRDRIVADTHGNPLALVEWPLSLTANELAGGFGRPAEQVMAGSLEDLFGLRLADLPRKTQRFLTLAAAEPTGDPIVVWRAAAILGVEPEDATPAVDAGLIELGVRLTFRHPLVRSAAYGSASVEDRQVAHRALGEATDAELDPDRRAWHEALGSTGPDEAIAASLERSARRARARGGFAAAGALLERSASMTLDPPQRSRRLLKAAAASLDAGSFDNALALLGSAELTDLDDAARAQVDLLRARHASLSGELGTSAELLLKAANRQAGFDAQDAPRTYIGAMSAVQTAGRFSGLTTRDIGLAASSWPGPDEPTVNDHLFLGLVQHAVDGTSAAAPSLRKVLSAPPDELSAADRFRWLGFHAAAASIMWDLGALHRMSDQFVAVTRQFGAVTLLPAGLCNLAQALQFEGELDTAAVCVGESIQITQATGSNQFAWVAPAIIALQADDDAERRLDDEQAAAVAAHHGFAENAACWAHATLANGQGRYDKAFVAASEAFRNPQPWFAHLWFHELVESAARSGHPDVAVEALEDLAESAEPGGTDWGLGVLAVESTAG